MKPEWGTKHECPGCGAHFYDMRKPDACCPKCATPADDRAALKAKTETVVITKQKKETDPLDDFDDIEVDDELGDEDDFIEDAEDLGDEGDTTFVGIKDQMNEDEMDQNL